MLQLAGATIVGAPLPTRTHPPTYAEVLQGVVPIVPSFGSWQARGVKVDLGGVDSGLLTSMVCMLVCMTAFSICITTHHDTQNYVALHMRWLLNSISMMELQPIAEYCVAQGDRHGTPV